MYQAFYGLVERPFDLSVNLKYFLMTAGHLEAVSNLEYGFSRGTGITLLLGEAGTGKTSVLQKVLTPLLDGTSDPPTRAVYINNPTLSPQEFVETLAHGFQLSLSAAASKSQFLRELEQTLIEHRANGATWILVVDEAQSLTDALLEEIRLLANFECEGEKLLRIVLAGQPALGPRLNEPGLLQLKQRIGLRCLLPALTLQEAAVYIARRITMAGGTPAHAFSREAVSMIHQRSCGIPRVINVICDNALLTGFAAGQRPVRAEIVLEVCADFDLREGLIGPPVAMPIPDPPVAEDEGSADRGRLTFLPVLARRR
jgi:general secretion pathway protein A